MESNTNLTKTFALALHGIIQAIETNTINPASYLNKT
jgi:hypothetical protein